MDVAPWIPVVMIAASVPFLLSMSRVLYRSVLATWWPTAAGSVEHVDLKTTPGDDGPMYTVEVRYRYSAAGQEHVGEAISFGYRGSNNARGNAALHEHLKTASRVQVRYNPRNPGQAVLACGVRPRDIGGLGFAAVFVIGPAGFLLPSSIAITAATSVAFSLAALFFLMPPEDLLRIAVLERHA